MPCISKCNLFGCCCNRPNDCCKPSCCPPSCCCKCCRPRPAAVIFGAGLFFDEDEPTFRRVITPGDLFPVPVADVTVPLNVFNPLLGMSAAGNSLVIAKSGLYELRYYIGTQFLSLFPYEVFVAKTEGGSVTPVAGTLEQAVFDDLSVLPADVPLERAPLLPLLPRYIAKTAQAYLDAGTALSLVVRVRSIGVLYVMPGALLSAQRIGDAGKPV